MIFGCTVFGTAINHLSFLPDERANQVLFAEDVVAEEFEVALLVVVNGDEDYAVFAEKVAGKEQAWQHEHQPCRV